MVAKANDALRVATEDLIAEMEALRPQGAAIDVAGVPGNPGANGTNSVCGRERGRDVRTPTGLRLSGHAPPVTGTSPP